MPSDAIKTALKEHKEIAEEFFRHYHDDLISLASGIGTAFRKGRKIIVCGDGSSKPIADYIANIFLSPMINNRKSFPAISLSTGNTAVSKNNPEGFEEISLKEIEVLAKKGDFLIIVSATDLGANVLKIINIARKKGIFTALMTGRKSHKKHKEKVDQIFVVHSDVPSRINEMHLIASNLLAELVERDLV